MDSLIRCKRAIKFSIQMTTGKTENNSLLVFKNSFLGQFLVSFHRCSKKCSTEQFDSQIYSQHDNSDKFSNSATHCR